MAALTSLKYPKKSHRKRVQLPRSSTDLAEFFGIMLGDGGINNPWQANITLNAVKDYQYSLYIQRLIKRLFGITSTSFKYPTRDALRILITGISVVDFLVARGLHRGNKLKQGLKIPSWILDNPKYRRAAVRGLIDTDGCIFVHTHTVARKLYSNIGLTFSSRSPELIYQVAAVFEEYGIMPHISARGTEIYLYRKEAVERYLRIFGSSNKRISDVYNKWRGG